MRGERRHVLLSLSLRFVLIFLSLYYGLLFIGVWLLHIPYAASLAVWGTKADEVTYQVLMLPLIIAPSIALPIIGVCSLRSEGLGDPGPRFFMSLLPVSLARGPLQSVVKPAREPVGILFGLAFIPLYLGVLCLLLSRGPILSLWLQKLGVTTVAFVYAIAWVASIAASCILFPQATPQQLERDRPY